MPRTTAQIIGEVRIAVLHGDDGKTHFQLADADFQSPVMVDPPRDFIVDMVTDAQQAAQFLLEIKEGMS